MVKQNNRTIPQIRFNGFVSEWKEGELNERVEFFTGLTYSPHNVQNGFGTLVLRSSNVKNGEIVDADNVYVDSKIVNSKNVEVGDIVVVVRNGSRSLIGKHAQIKKRMDNTVVGAFMTGIRSERPSFINALLDTTQFDKEIARNLGATINQITNGAFREMMFHFPNPDEETKIGEYFHELDSLIGLHQRKHDKLVTLKKAMLQKMFPQPGATAPEIRFKGFSGEWEEKMIGDILSETKRSIVLEDNQQYELVTVKRRNAGVVSRGRLWGRDILVKNYSQLEPGDFLISKRQVVHGATGVVPAALNGAIVSNEYLVAVGNSRVSTHFFAILSSLPDMHKKFFLSSYGVDIEKLFFDAEDWKRRVVRIPKLPEQGQISTYFSTLDQLVSRHAIQLRKLKQLKSACLEKMFV
jgi:type I restriction enzyme S subunit